MGLVQEETIKLAFFMMKFVGAAIAVLAGATWYSSAQKYVPRHATMLLLTVASMTLNIIFMY